MAELIEVVRRANARQAARSMGQDVRQPRAMTLGVKAQGREADIVSLPEDPDSCPALQVLDTASPNFGLFYFTPSYDRPGDPNHPIR